MKKSGRQRLSARPIRSSKPSPLYRSSLYRSLPKHRPRLSTQGGGATYFTSGNAQSHKCNVHVRGANSGDLLNAGRVCL